VPDTWVKDHTVQKVIIAQTHAQPIALPGPLKWSVKLSQLTFISEEQLNILFYVHITVHSNGTQ